MVDNSLVSFNLNKKEPVNLFKSGDFVEISLKTFHVKMLWQTAVDMDAGVGNIAGKNEENVDFRDLRVHEHIPIAVNIYATKC